MAMTGDGATADLIKNSSDQTFMADVIEPSREVPVLVDFWAPWCGPCRQLGPAIERAVSMAKGAVRLVKINIDENPGIAGQLRVQSIPAVFAFKDGQPVDGFMGAIPESQIQDFIKRLTGDGPSAEELAEILKRAEAAFAEGDPGGASQDYAMVAQMDPGNPEALAGLARIWFDAGEVERAEEILKQVPAERADHPAVKGVRTAMELAASGGNEATAELVVAVRDNPANLEARFELAQAYLAEADYQAAADQLLAITALEKEWNDKAARELLLKVFEAAGPNSEVTRNGRRRLSSLLFA